MKDFVKLRYFLHIEIATFEMGLIMNQRKYTLDLLKEIKKMGCRLVIEINHKLSIKDGKPKNDDGKEKYQRLVGKLI